MSCLASGVWSSWRLLACLQKALMTTPNRQQPLISFFQLMFCAATASIVPGALAERIKLWPVLFFTAVLTGLIYPLQASWKWGGGFLDVAGLMDFTGSTVVHSVGGWAALVGAVILGARLGKYKGGGVVPMLGSNLLLATLGTFILWLAGLGLTVDHSLLWARLGTLQMYPDFCQHKYGGSRWGVCRHGRNSNNLWEGGFNDGVERGVGWLGVNHRSAADADNGVGLCD